jgi:hypothetical protein
LARAVLTQNWVQQVKEDNVTLSNIDELDAEPGQLGKAWKLISPPPSLMHSQYAGALAPANRKEDDRGGNKKGGQTRRLPNSLLWGSVKFQ